MDKKKSYKSSLSYSPICPEVTGKRLKHIQLSLHVQTPLNYADSPLDYQHMGNEGDFETSLLFNSDNGD